MTAAAESAPVGRATRFAAWLTPLGLAAIGWRYLAVVADASTDPPNQGNNLWLIIWTITAVAVIVAVALAPRGAAFMCGFAIAGAAVTIIVRSGLPAAAVIAAWLLTVSILVGDRILNALGLEVQERFLERLTIALPIGVVTLSFATFALAVSGLFRPSYAWGLMIVLSVIEARHAISLFGHAFASVRAPSLPALPVRESHVLLVLTTLVMLANLVWAVAPEVEYDSLNYHLAVPRFYLEAGGLIDLPYFFHSYFAHLPDMFFGLSMALQGEMAAKLANFALGAASMAGVFCLGELVFTRRVGVWAAALYYTTPLTGSLTGTTYTDLTVGFFLTTSLIAFLRWRRSNDRGWIAVCGFLAGSAVAVKLNALYAVIGLGLAIGGSLLLTAGGVGNKLRSAFCWGGLAVAAAVPWYLPAYVYTGNPTFPLLNGIFKSPRTHPVNSLMDSPSFGVGTSPNALIELPARLTFNPRFGTSPGAVGVLALFAAPFGLVLLLARRNPEARLIGFVGGVYMAFWIMTFQYSRYYMAVLPIVAVLGVAGVLLLYHTKNTERITRIAMLTLLVAQASLLSIQHTNLPERFPIRLALGLETREAFLSRVLPGYRAAKHVNQSILPGQRVLGVETEHLRFYLTPPIDVMSETLLDHPLRTAVGSDEQVARSLARIGYAYLLVSHTALRFPDPWHLYIKPPFLDQFATLEYDDGQVAAYRLKYAPVPQDADGNRDPLHSRR